VIIAVKTHVEIVNIYILNIFLELDSYMLSVNTQDMLDLWQMCQHKRDFFETAITACSVDLISFGHKNSLWFMVIFNFWVLSILVSPKKLQAGIPAKLVKLHSS
jgi:uncharacterized protein YfkK (UPF0435 family)